MTEAEMLGRIHFLGAVLSLDEEKTKLLLQEVKKTEEGKAVSADNK